MVKTESRVVSKYSLETGNRLENVILGSGVDTMVGMVGDSAGMVGVSGHPNRLLSLELSENGQMINCG